MTRPRIARPVVPVVAVLATAALAACGSGTEEEPEANDITPEATAPATRDTTSDTSADNTDNAAGGEIIVSAAASLTDAFTEVGTAFEAVNPDAAVTFTFGPSSGLATQIVEGAPADVAAFANESTMQTIVDAGAVDGEPTIFATNDLVIVTKPGNPEGIAGVVDLVDVGVVALCGADVPCGTFSQEVLDSAGVSIPETNVTRGEDARATLTAVSQGDAVAAIVYDTDAASAGGAVDTVEIPADINVLAAYPIAPLSASANAATAGAFVEFVLSTEAQQILADYGFAPPTS